MVFRLPPEKSFVGLRLVGLGFGPEADDDAFVGGH